jgi:hypothetical protein
LGKDINMNESAAMNSIVSIYYTFLYSDPPLCIAGKLTTHV